jgi:subtilisin family serine protease
MSPLKQLILITSAVVLAGIVSPAPLPLAAATLPAASGWEQKLDPFLRRVALGTTRTQGQFVDHIPARAREIVASLPSFVLADRTAADPVLFVKAKFQNLGGAPGRLAADPTAPVPDLAARLAALGVTLRGRAGDIVSLAVPASTIEALASQSDVLWLAASHSYRLQNDVSTSDTYTGSRTENTTFGNAGQGVIVAVFDTGLDFTDDDFRNPDGTTRVLGIWDQTLSDGAHPPPAGFLFGAYYSKADIDASLSGGPSLLTQDGYGHGTHVTGSAAGNGRHTGNGIPAGTFAGVAPGADLLVVRVFDDAGGFCADCDLVAGLQFVDQFAKAAGKPWVGNMSLGDDIGGAHDGSSPDELAIDAVVGAGHAGTQVAIAAGNSGSTSRHFHWQGTLAAGLTFTNTFTLSGTAAGGTDNDIIAIDIWYAGADTATVQVITPGATTVSAAKGTNPGLVCTTSGGVQIDHSNAPYAPDGDNEAFIFISDNSACTPVVEPATGTWTIKIVTNAVGASGGGPFDAWNQATARGNAFVNFNTFSLAKSVSVPGTSRNAMTAGAFNSKNSWTNGTGGTSSVAVTLGALAGFSAIGPTRDGRIKPDVAAPGQEIGSSRSHLISVPSANQERDGIHYVLQGTSMATPHVAGTMALLYALNPALDGAELRAAIQRTARADLQTGTVPNLSWGAGKLRALDAAYDASAMVTDMSAALTPGSFSWPAVPTVLSWNVYRGTIPGISSTNYGTCFLSGLSSPSFSDPATPTLGQGFFYLVTGLYTNPSTLATVEGSLGTDSSGKVRPNNSPCP